MTQKKDIVLSIDVMGGDIGPEVTLGGSALALENHPDLRFLLHGIPEDVLPVLEKYPDLEQRSFFYETKIAIGMDEKPSAALRRGRRDSSMWNAIESVKNGEADACVSAGNTGALMVMSKLCLQMMPLIDRPAIAGVWPTLKGYCLVLDIGATIGASAQHLVNLAIMGAGMSRALFGHSKPKVGLLNIGVEEVKGLDEIREASQILKEISFDDLEYYGFIEGNDIGEGVVDVIVTEGFVGNMILKTAEGTARQVSQVMREEIQKSFSAKLGYLFIRKALNIARERLNPDRFNGGGLLGLNGLVVKSHGGAGIEGFAAAIQTTKQMVVYNLLNSIKKDLEQTKNKN